MRKLSESRKERERREEAEIMRMMDAMEADACRIFTPYADDPGMTIRRDKRGRGGTVIETVAMRLSQRKGIPLPCEDDPRRVGPDRDARGRIHYNTWGGFQGRSDAQRLRRERERREKVARRDVVPVPASRFTLNTRIARQRWQRKRQQERMKGISDGN